MDFKVQLLSFFSEEERKMSNSILILIHITAAYVIGSIPTSYIAGKIFKGIDIREHGSGNVGATNAVRVLGVKIGIPVMLVDIFKGAIPVIIARSTLSDIEHASEWLLLVGVATIVGHIFTLFLRFKGGKGVATSAGVFGALTPIALGFALAVFIILVAVSRYVSLGSIFAAFTLAVSQIVLFIAGKESSVYLLALTCVIALLIIVKHKKNISRLVKGNENKLTFTKK